MSEAGVPFFEAVARFTVRVMEQTQHAASQLGADDDEAMDAENHEHTIDLLLTATLDLLEAWLLFSSPLDGSAAAPSPFAPYAQGIFRAYVTTRLALAGHDMNEDLDDDDEDSQRVKDRLQHHEELLAATHLARLAPGPCAAYLAQALSAARALLEQGLSDSKNSVAALDAMEKLHWLTLISGPPHHLHHPPPAPPQVNLTHPSGHFLCDLDEGDDQPVPIPERLFSASQHVPSVCQPKPPNFVLTRPG